MGNIDKLTTEEKEKLGIRKYAKAHLSTFYGKMVEENSIYHDTDSVKMQIPKLGVCYKCGNTNGPWTWTAKGWLCEDCEVEDNGRKSESGNKSGDKSESGQ